MKNLLIILIILLPAIALAVGGTIAIVHNHTAAGIFAYLSSVMLMFSTNINIDNKGGK